jgi:Peptidase family M48
VRTMDWQNRSTLRLWIALSLVFIIQSAADGRSAHNVRRIKGTINHLKKQLAISNEIRSKVVAKNPLIVSVKPIRGEKGVFEISFEEAFLNMLDDEDLEAVVAHELGHVWIFTHHPYLQTEDLANSIAYRAITTNALDRVYEKMRLRQSMDSRLATARTGLIR